MPQTEKTSASQAVDQLRLRRILRRILRRDVALPLGAGLVTLVLLVGLVAYLVSTMGSVEHSERVIADANDMLRLAVDRESSMRGFLITGNESLLVPYESGGPTFTAQLDALRKQVADNPPQVERLKQIEALQERWSRFAEQIIDARRRNQDYETAIAAGRGKFEFDETRREFGDFLDVESDLRQQRVEATRHVTSMLVGACLLFSIVVSALLAWRGRALLEPQRRLEAQQAELEQSNVQLAEYVQRLERQKSDLLRAQNDLAANAKRLEQLSRYKSEFLANMSHELRTPLNSSLIFATLLQQNRSGNLSDEQVRYAQTIHASNSDLLVLINDLLDLSKVEAGQLTVEPEAVSIEATLQSLEAMFQPIASARHLRLAFGRLPGTPDTFVTDGQRLTQILRNLLSNAVKFTEHGEVTLAVALVEGDVLRFDVRDSGIGIPADKLDMIFEAFKQVDGSTSRQYGGSGLGLSISREFARLLGGRITVASEVGKGSAFTLWLPLDARAALAAVGSQALNGAATRNIFAVSRLLEPLGG